MDGCPPTLKDDLDISVLFVAADQLVEESINSLPDILENEVSYKVLPGTSHCSGKLLADTLGYTCHLDSEQMQDDLHLLSA